MRRRKSFAVFFWWDQYGRRRRSAEKVGKLGMIPAMNVPEWFQEKQISVLRGIVVMLSDNHGVSPRGRSLPCLSHRFFIKRFHRHDLLDHIFIQGEACRNGVSMLRKFP